MRSTFLREPEKIDRFIFNKSNHSFLISLNVSEASRLTTRTEVLMATGSETKYVYTIGHSNRPLNGFVESLKKYNIDLLVDVRSYPYSQYNPHFNRHDFAEALSDNGIKYLFLGEYLGGRPKDPTCYKGGEIPKSKVNYLEAVDYCEVAKREWYNEGIKVLLNDINSNQIVIMCSEEDPYRCHRHHLIANTLLDKGILIKHIRRNNDLDKIFPKFYPNKNQLLQQLRLSDMNDNGTPFQQNEKNINRNGDGFEDKKTRIYTIGFTQKSANKFFELLKENRIQVLLDVRLKPSGQLAGFAKKEDLRYFLSQLVNCGYQHSLALAPTEQILSEYKTDKNWLNYVKKFESLMDKRDIPNSLDRHLFDDKICCLLCSEAMPDKCHRKLVADRLARTWQNIEIIHLI